MTHVNINKLPEPAWVETARKTTNETKTMQSRSTWVPSQFAVAIIENQALL